MLYQGIELTLPKGKVSLSHSTSLDLILGTSSTQNMDWLDVLGDFPWSLLKEEYYQGYDNVCRLYSLLNLDYQVCNGGIAQYFGNRYHEPRDPHHGDDVALYGIDEQKKEFKRLVSFAREVYPERAEENTKLENTCDAFDQLWFEEEAESFETIYCEEDEYIIDPETGEEVENPEYFEPYEETVYEDIIHGQNGFNNTFYESNDYLEELLELRAQFFCKLFARDLELHAAQHPDLTQKMRGILPPEAYDHHTAEKSHTDLSLRIEDASFRSAVSPRQDSKTVILEDICKTDR